MVLSRRHEIPLVVLLLAATLAIAYWNVVFAGQSLVYSDNLDPLRPVGGGAPGEPRPYVEYAPSSSPRAQWDERNLRYTANFHDPWSSLGEWEPAGAMLREALRRHEIPLWNPWVGGGTPDLPDPIAAYFFPPYLAMVALGNTSLLRNAYSLALALAAGVFGYFFLRRHDLAALPSAFGAVAWMLSGALAQNAGSILGQTTACLAPALWATRWFLDRPTWRRAAALGAVYATVSLASFVSIVLAIFALVVVYAATMIAAGAGASDEDAALDGGSPSRSTVALRFAVAAAIGLGLVAFCYLPFFALYAELPAQVAKFYDGASGKRLPVAGLYSLLSATAIHGGKVQADPPMRGLAEWSKLQASPEWLMMPYVGMVPIAVALVARPPRRRRSRRLLWITCAALAVLTLKLLGWLPLDPTAYIPGLAFIHYVPYFGVLYGFLFAVIGAIAVQGVIEGRVTSRRVLAAATVLAAILGTLRWLAARNGALAHTHAASWLRSWWWLAALAAGVVLALGLGARALPGSRGARAAAVVLVALGVVEGVANTVYPRNERFDVWRHPEPYVTALQRQAGLGRVFVEWGVLHPNAPAAFGLATLDSLKLLNSERTFALYRRYVHDRQNLVMMHADRLPPEGVLDRAAIGLVAVRARNPSLVKEAEARGYERFFADDVAILYRRAAAPRYVWSSAYRVLHPDAALEAIAAPASDRTVLLEQAPSFASLPNRDDDPPVEVVRFGRNGYTVRVDAPRPGLLYCSESFYDGWRARVNGRPATILRADYAFRAVEVPAGPVTVELEYWPPRFTAGLAISGGSVVVVAALLAFRTRPRRRDGTRLGSVQGGRSSRPAA